MTEQEITEALLRMRNITTDASGWESLYREPETGEFWEVTYPHGEMHGGGPRELRPITAGDAVVKYGIADA
jgi:hypothetical protein